MLKSGLLVPAAVYGMGPLGSTIEVAAETSGALPIKTPALELTAARTSLAGFWVALQPGECRRSVEGLRIRERKDREFPEDGNLLPAGSIAFDDGDWRSVDLSHDWAVELLFQNDPALSSKRVQPAGRNYPATSVGWYPASSNFPLRTLANGSRSSSMVRTGRRWC